MNEIVKYDNHLNRVCLDGFSPLELNIFYTALSMVREKGSDEVTISYSEICRIANIRKTTVGYVFELLKETRKKIFDLHLEPLYTAEETGKQKPDICQHIFSSWNNDPNTKTLTLGIDLRFLWLLNDLGYNFTSFELIEFVNLRSMPAKNLFKFLKQWKTVGRFRFNSMDEVRSALNISENMQDRYILAKVIRPAIEEIRKKTGSFTDLTCEGIYEHRSHKLTGYVLTWTPEAAPAGRQIAASAGGGAGKTQTETETGTAAGDAAPPDHAETLISNSQETGWAEESVTAAPEDRAEDTVSSDSGDDASGIRCRLGRQTLTEEAYERLCAKHGTEQTDLTLKRILERPYHGCLTEETVDTWTAERVRAEQKSRAERKPKNRFHNFEQREYTEEELEAAFRR